MPKGFKIILGLATINSFLQLILITSGQYSVKITKFYLPDPVALVFNIVFLILSVLLVLAIIKRARWGWRVFLYFNIYLVVTTFPTFLYDLYDSHLAEIASSILVYGFFILIQAVVFLYVKGNKKYFKK